LMRRSEAQTPISSSGRFRRQRPAGSFISRTRNRSWCSSSKASSTVLASARRP
jgi:hypothetical protein